MTASAIYLNTNLIYKKLHKKVILCKTLKLVSWGNVESSNNNKKRDSWSSLVTAVAWVWSLLRLRFYPLLEIFCNNLRAAKKEEKKKTSILVWIGFGQVFMERLSEGWAQCLSSARAWFQANPALQRPFSQDSHGHSSKGQDMDASLWGHPTSHHINHGFGLRGQGTFPYGVWEGHLGAGPPPQLNSEVLWYPIREDAAVTFNHRGRLKRELSPRLEEMLEQEKCRLHTGTHGV